MKISVFGNADLSFDSVPVKILPALQKRFPKHSFVVEDPNELDLPKDNDWIIIDTVQDLKDIRVITLDEIAQNENRATVHDFDLATHLLLARKVNPDFTATIVGVPMFYDEKKAADDVTALLKNLL